MLFEKLPDIILANKAENRVKALQTRPDSDLFLAISVS